MSTGFDPFSEEKQAELNIPESSGATSRRKRAASPPTEIPNEILSGDPVSLEDGVSVKIADSGAIVTCEVPLIPGKLTELIGSNGAGKSTVQRTLNGVLNKSGAGLTPRDGVEAGSVEWPGVRVRIGKRMSVSGDPGQTFVVIDDGDELSQFIDPGIDKPAAADKRRIESLLLMAGVSVDDSAFIEFIGEANWKQFTAEVNVAKVSVVDKVSALKRWIDAKAKTSEVLVQQQAGVLEGLGPAIADDIVVEDAEAISRELAEVSGTIREMESALRTAENAKKSIELMGESDCDAGQLSSQLTDLSEKSAELARQKSELQAKISEIDQQITVFGSERDVLSSRIDQVNRFNQQKSDLMAKISSSVSADEIAELKKKELDLSSRSHRAVLAAKQRKDAAEQNEKISKAQAAKSAAESRAALLREKAQRTSALLADAVKSLPGWYVESDGADVRLACDHVRRGKIFFDQLSPGEKAVRGLEVICKKTGVWGGRIPYASIDQSIWESLDAENKQHVLQFGADNGIALLTARASRDGEENGLHVSVLEAPVVDAHSDSDEAA